MGALARAQVFLRSGTGIIIARDAVTFPHIYTERHEIWKREKGAAAHSSIEVSNERTDRKTEEKKTRHIRCFHSFFNVYFGPGMFASRCAAQKIQSAVYAIVSRHTQANVKRSTFFFFSFSRRRFFRFINCFVFVSLAAQTNRRRYFNYARKFGIMKIGCVRMQQVGFSAICIVLPQLKRLINDLPIGLNSEWSTTVVDRRFHERKKMKKNAKNKQTVAIQTTECFSSLCLHLWQTWLKQTLSRAFQRFFSLSKSSPSKKGVSRRKSKNCQ